MDNGIEKLLAEPVVTLTDEALEHYKKKIGRDPRTLIPEQRYVVTLIAVKHPDAGPGETLAQYMTEATRAYIDDDPDKGYALRLAIALSPTVPDDDGNDDAVISYVNTTYATMIGNGIPPRSDEAIRIQAMLLRKLMPLLSNGMADILDLDA